jgi:alpha-tubulin suppressor-like RCC1 family protein
VAWGDNLSGQLGNGNNNSSNIPVAVSGLTSGVSAIAAGGDHSIALKSDGTVWAWGDNQLGQLGNGNNIASNTPVQVSGLTDVTAIAAGDNHSLALKDDGTVWAWGDNQFGQLGDGTNSTRNIPVQSTGLVP